jgi:hypothetical protein
MDNALDFDPAEATEYAKRLNIVPIALFCVWLGSTVMFWLQAFGPLRSFNRASPDEAPFWWLVGSLFTSYAISFLPLSWYSVHRFEANGRFYEGLGVKAIRALVSNGDLINRFVRRRFPGYRVYAFAKRIDKVTKDGRSNELSHLISFGGGLVVPVYAWRIGWTDWAVWLTLANLLVNLYPVLVQRYTRARIEKITSRRP